VQNSEFRQSAYCALRADLHSFPSLVGNSYNSNAGNGLCLLPESGESIDTNATWAPIDTSYYLRGNITVILGRTLTLSPGIVVKVGLNNRLTINGKLLVQGSGAAPVIITSYRDDQYGKGANWDTDGGGPSTCSPGDWDGIFFTDTSDDTSTVNHALARCAGDGYYVRAAINLDHASPHVQNSDLTNNAFGIVADTSTPVLSCNNIHVNSNYGLYNKTPATVVVAENQWWGNPSGPYHPTLNPNGTGNAVSDGVDFIPYRTSLCSSEPPPPPLRVRSSGPQDGWLLESGENSNQGGLTNATANNFIVGDHFQNRQYRAILHFNTGALPDNAVITRVVLKIKKHSLTGSNPFTTLGKIAVDIRQGAFSQNASLQPTDFQAAASKVGVGVIANNPTAGGWYAAALNATAYPFINLRGGTQLRLRFQRDDDNDRVADFLRFFSGDAAAADRPVLVVEYYVP
jgi:hypothetical protein